MLDVGPRTGRLFFILSLVACSCGSPDHSGDELFEDPKQYTGMADLAAMHPSFPCDGLLTALRDAPAPALAVLYGTFGTDESCVRRYTEAVAARPHVLRVYLSYAHPNDRHFAGDLPPGDAELEDRAREVKRFVQAVRNPMTRVRYVLELEHRHGEREAARLASIAESVLAHSVQLNPIHADGGTGDRVKEMHGTAAWCGTINRVVSEDGSVHDAGESREWLADNSTCSERYLWRPAHQGLCVYGDLAERCIADPHKRTFTYNDADELNALLKGTA